MHKTRRYDAAHGRSDQGELFPREKPVRELIELADKCVRVVLHPRPVGKSPADEVVAEDAVAGPDQHVVEVVINKIGREEAVHENDGLFTRTRKLIARGAVFQNDIVALVELSVAVLNGTRLSLEGTADLIYCSHRGFLLPAFPTGMVALSFFPILTFR